MQLEINPAFDDPNSEDGSEILEKFSIKYVYSQLPSPSQVNLTIPVGIRGGHALFPFQKVRNDLFICLVGSDFVT